MGERDVSSFTSTGEIDQEISRLADEIKEMEFLHKNLQLVRKLLGSAISQAQSASKTPPVSPNNLTLNSLGTTGSSSFSYQKACAGCPGSSPGNEGSGGDGQRVCACSPDNCIRVCVNPRVTQEMEQHLATAQQQQRQRSPPPPPSPQSNAPYTNNYCDNDANGTPPTISPQANNQSSSPSSGGTGSTLVEFQVPRYPGIRSARGAQAGGSTSSGSRSTLDQFTIRTIPPHERGQIVVGLPVPLTNNSCPYSSYSNNNDSTGSSFQPNRQPLNYFETQFPHIAQYSPAMTSGNYEQCQYSPLPPQTHHHTTF